MVLLSNICLPKDAAIPEATWDRASASEEGSNWFVSMMIAFPVAEFTGVACNVM